MKKLFVICVIVLVSLSLISCSNLGLRKSSEEEASEYAEKIADLESEIKDLKNQAENNLAEEIVEDELAPTIMPSQAPTPTPEQTPSGMSDVPVGNPRMYSSYAHMVSYDPARGWADFDYFEMYTGSEAVDALVDYEGYTYPDAQAEVNSYHEGEFYEKNTNPQTRTIDLKIIDIELLVQTDGTIIPDIANPPNSTVQDAFDLYNANPNYLYSYFFYFVTVDGNGNVTKVEQVYRP